jgi:hypothetical protein
MKDMLGRELAPGQWIAYHTSTNGILFGVCIAPTGPSLPDGGAMVMFDGKDAVNYAPSSTMLAIGDVPGEMVGRLQAALKRNGLDDVIVNDGTRYLAMVVSQDDPQRLDVYGSEESRDEDIRARVQGEQLNSFDDSLFFAEIKGSSCPAFYRVEIDEFEGGGQDD